uniref:Facilitated trehalose transporter Tret1 n=1 Tax=Cacopsylla melanoneura TaxID=428564 RepID=A0A8D8Q6F1_9HEMI
MDRLLPPSNQEEYPNPLDTERDQYAELSSSNGHPTRRRNLYLAAFGANLASVASGCAMAWSSPSIPKLKDQGLIDDNQGSWLTSLLAVGASIGPFLAYRLVDRIGRRTTIILNMLVIIISWALLDIAPVLAPHIPSEFKLDTLNIMYIARFLSGIGVGCSFMVTPLYIAEISDTLVRSALCSSMQLFLIVGFLVEYTVGPYYSSTVLNGVSLVPPILCVLVFACVLPDSPLFLLQQGNGEGAFRALQWLRQQHDVYGEIGSSQKSLEESRSLEVVSWVGLLTTPFHIKCLSYGLILIFFQQFSGVPSWLLLFGLR